MKAAWLSYPRLIGAYLLLVLVLHLIPTTGSDGTALSSRTIIFFRADYLLHLLIFIPFMVLVWLHLDREQVTGAARFNYALLWLVAGSIYAALLEGLHLLVPYRTFNPVDLVLNVAGVVTGSLIFLWDRKRFARLK